MVLIRFLVLISLSILIGAFVALNSREACAQSAACDSDFETVLNARATLEAMREVEIAQTLILKPDSVLEYSCFDDRISDLGISGNFMFSDNVASADLFQAVPAPNVSTYSPGGPYPGYLPTYDETAVNPPATATGQAAVVFGPNPPPFPPGALVSGGLDNSLNTLVFSTMTGFLGLNFPHAYAGGTFFGFPTAGVCDPMNAVWEHTKCVNFDRVLFQGFSGHAGSDPRQDPIVCNDINRGAIWSASVAAAYPAPGSAGGVDTLFQNASASINFNVYLRYLRETNSAACGAVAPIPTGVRVYQVPTGGGAPSDVHADFVCAPAGCFYDNTTLRCNGAP